MERCKDIIPPVDGLAGFIDVQQRFKWEIPQTFNFGSDVIDRIARECDGPALICENEAGAQQRYAYSDIAELSSKFANVLADKGIGKGDFVLVMLPRIAEWPVAMVALLKLGAIPIPCIEMLTQRDLMYRAENSGAVGAICRAEHCAKFEGWNFPAKAKIAIGQAPGWSSYEAEIARASGTFEAVQVQAEDPCIMYYTSGSTGNPKGVLHSSRALYSWWVSAAYWLDLRPGDIIWCTADTGWSKAGTSILFGPWSRGACSFIYDGPFDPSSRLRLLEKHRVNVYCAPSTELFRLLDEPIKQFDLSALRRTVSAGESVNPVVSERWRAATGMDVAEAYGQTETLMTVVNYANQEVRPGSMGRAGPGCHIEIIGPDGDVLTDGEEGDIALLLPNPQMMLGYWKDPERTAACFLNGRQGHWYITGDRGRRDQDGYIWYAGRKDDIINTAGYRVGPMEIENALLEHPSVLECAVVGKKDSGRGEIVKAFVVLRNGYHPYPAMVAELQQHCKAQTAPYKYPREIAFIDSIPKTPTGKIRRAELRNR
ncbi:MAG: AMP-binding protein [Anaerolineales bacterium]|nr:AMP-binding protein [Anaerolineales bacterium]